MRRHSSVPFLPLLLFYIFALVLYLSPSSHLRLATASPLLSPPQPKDDPQAPVKESNQPLETNDSNNFLQQESLQQYDSAQTKFNSFSRLQRKPYEYHSRHHQQPLTKISHHDNTQESQEHVLVLRHILHHGGVRYPNLFRQKDLHPEDVLLSEMLTGQSLTHRLRSVPTTTLKPRDTQQQQQQQQQQHPNTFVRSQGFRSQGFRTNGETSIGPEAWTKETVAAPDVTDRETILQLAKMNYNSYTEVDSPGWYDLEGRWTVNSTFGWEEDGVRGHVFLSQDNSTLIIAIKGTSAAILGGGGGTATRDKINDNLLFSCCCAKVDRTWRGVCDCNTGGYQCDQTCVENSVNSDDVYYNITMSILWAVQDMYPNANVWLTGHSLGGGLSALLGLTFGVPTVTFETPGDRLAAQRLHLPMPPAINWDDFPLYHIGHTADPIFLGVCNGARSACYYSGFAMESKCHTGRTCIYDPVTEDNWKVDIRTHRLFDTIEGVLKLKDVPKCAPEKDCVDCEMWEYF
ncbi:putative lipase atg15 [Podila epigama]|nr:putative lipase atg15 [Podila epigama]